LSIATTPSALGLGLDRIERWFEAAGSAAVGAR